MLLVVGYLIVHDPKCFHCFILSWSAHTSLTAWQVSSCDHTVHFLFLSLPHTNTIIRLAWGASSVIARRNWSGGRRMAAWCQLDWSGVRREVGNGKCRAANIPILIRVYMYIPVFYTHILLVFILQTLIFYGVKRRPIWRRKNLHILEHKFLSFHIGWKYKVFWTFTKYVAFYQILWWPRCVFY